MFRIQRPRTGAVALLTGTLIHSLPASARAAEKLACEASSPFRVSSYSESTGLTSSCAKRKDAFQFASVEIQPSFFETFSPQHLSRPGKVFALPASVMTPISVMSSSAKSVLAAMPTDELPAAERAAIGLRTTEHVLVQAEGSFSSITHEAQVKVLTETIENTAGTYGDPSRYFQVLPGVVSDKDQRNDLLVRGGNPEENLFVIDGIVIPSINHLALSNTTGGFVSMIDNDAIESLTMHSGVHDAHFQDRLSSVVEISTIPEGSRPARKIVDAGLNGLGVSASTPWGADEGSAFIALHKSILNNLTNDIGLNGVPNYKNALLRFNRSLGEHDKVWGLSLTGVDSIAIRPDPKDPEETNTFNIDYSGWRSTSGVNWQHVFYANTFAVATFSNAEQAQHIRDFDQLLGNTTTYSEISHEGTSTANFSLTSVVTRWLLANVGVTHSLGRINYNIQQPVPLPNPYSALPKVPSNTSILQQFHTSTDSAFAQGTIALAHDATLTLSGRADHWGYGDHTSLTPRGLFSVPLFSHRVGVGYAEYTQMPSYLYLLAFPSNNSLKPIRAEHTTFDMEVVKNSRAKLTFSAYRKLYFDYPAPTAFPQLSIANIADTFGQSFLLFPLVSQGRGKAKGVEVNLESRPMDRLHVNASFTYARAYYSGLDGVMRRGNFDIPLLANVTAYLMLGKGFALSTRYSGASGRPYTPDDLALSKAENRDVYDLNRINLNRSDVYGRFDFRVEKRAKLGSGEVAWNLGLLNAFNRKNFYDYIWAVRAVAHKNNPLVQQGDSEQDQLPRFPEGSIRYTF